MNRCNKIMIYDDVKNRKWLKKKVKRLKRINNIHQIDHISQYKIVVFSMELWMNAFYVHRDFSRQIFSFIHFHIFHYISHFRNKQPPPSLLHDGFSSRKTMKINHSSKCIRFSQTFLAIFNDTNKY